MGFWIAGFDVTGVDIDPQPYYPFDFVQSDWLQALWDMYQDFDIIKAGPPCQAYTMAAEQWRRAGKKYPDLIADVRRELRKTGKPYVIENVPRAPLIDPIILNGSVFGLLVHRPRLFECSFPVEQPYIPKTKPPVKMGRPVKPGDIIQPVGHFSGVQYAREQMGIDWLPRKYLTQAIPPAYTKYIAKQWLKGAWRCQQITTPTAQDARKFARTRSSSRDKR